MTVVTTAVALFVAVTVTPGSNAWLLSSIVPLTVAYVDWPNARAENVTDSSSATKIERLLTISRPSSIKSRQIDVDA